MAKRQAEDELDGVDDPAPKRSRVDIADLLGSDGDVGNSSSGSGPVQHANGHSVVQHPDDNTASVNSNEAVIHPQAEAVPSGSTSQTALAQAPLNALATTSEQQAQGGTVVYIAFMKHEWDENTDQDLLGVFSNVSSANNVVIQEFLNYHQPGDDNDDRKRSYGPDGEVSCSYRPEEYGEHGMEFWVERHVVDRPSKSVYEIQDHMAKFDQAFEGFDEDEEE
ncbi:hypothetical protein PRZ48_014213 [Zasmidium cellare]|uniref:Uncharacterized protein n=1 Tax=Zasmidium cellare TaxID=395010 RepID=A0ABR0E0B2_ZASCE|nr:hypothetical protein PRZ48_014213 [Zasmidium cellare]